MAYCLDQGAVLAWLPNNVYPRVSTFSAEAVSARTAERYTYLRDAVNSVAADEAQKNGFTPWIQFGNEVLSRRQIYEMFFGQTKQSP